jgi:hypothetical protein
MNNIVLFTPVYYSSPGTQMRVDLIKKSLELSGFRTKLIIYGDHGAKRLYNLLGDKLLTKDIFWRLIGRRIADRIIGCNPDAIIMFTDVCASAIPFLVKRRVKVVFSIEDLTPEYKEYPSTKASKFYELLRDYSCEADLIITPSFTLEQRLKGLDIMASTVLIGVENVISLMDALERDKIILHAGQLDDIRKVSIIHLIADNHKVMVHEVGKLLSKLKHPNVIRYRFESPEKALEFCKKASIGLVIEYRRAYTLSRLYYHIALLQPIIGQGEGPWMNEANRLGISIYSVSLLEDILDNYEKFVSSLVNIREHLKIPNIHNKLIAFLQRI